MSYFFEKHGRTASEFQKKFGGYIGFLEPSNNLCYENADACLDLSGQSDDKIAEALEASIQLGKNLLLEKFPQLVEDPDVWY
ncbi:MAG: hypothetical protein LBT21_04365 [Oscillospiraceae bacterium]|jgi:hypothetical protein|nr:hypothetical protein [Oscillospiraceae bacterium]